jgi:dCMP deaminase
MSGFWPHPLIQSKEQWEEKKAWTSMSHEPRKRPSWDDYFMDFCEVVSTRSTCDRKYCGAVLVQDNRIIATGYNGSLPGLEHCDESTSPFPRCDECGLPMTLAIEENMDHQPARRFFYCDGCQTSKLVLETDKPHNHDMEDGHCVRTVHAEVNAVAQAARVGHPTQGSTLYCNTRPCWKCFQTIVAAGVVEIIYRDEYRSTPGDRLTAAAEKIPGLTLRRYK